MEMPDKYFKQMLDQASTPYEPMFWNSASAFIAREERRRRRRVVFWWIGSFAVLIGVAAFTWAIFSKDATETNADPFASVVTTQSPIQAVPSANQASDLPSSNHEALLQEHSYKTSYTPSRSQQRNKANTTSRAEATNVSLEINNGAIHAKTRDIPDRKDSPKISTHEDQLIGAKENSLEKWSETQINPTTDIDLATGYTIERADLNPIGLPFRIQEAKQTLARRETQPLIRQVQVRKHKFNGFLSTSAMFNPAWKNDQLFTLGFAAGGGLQYTYAEKWSLRTGLYYLHRWGTFDVMLDHPTPVYGFVKNDKGYTLVPTDAAYLDMPVSLGYTLGKVQMGAGITVMRLLGAKGKVFSYEGEPSENDPGTLVYRSSQISSGWIETPGFKNWILNYQLYLEYPLSKRMQLGCRLDYISSGLVKENYQYYYQHDTGSYEWKRASGLLENKYQWHIYIHYTL
jgi:hypothetical protein